MTGSVSEFKDKESPWKNTTSVVEAAWYVIGERVSLPNGRPLIKIAEENSFSEGEEDRKGRSKRV